MEGDGSPSRVGTDQTGYDPTTETYYAQHDWENERPLTTTIVETVAVVTNNQPSDLEPMNDAIDPEALERIIHSLRNADRRSGGNVRFRFNDLPVVVSSDGEICVDCESAEFS